MADEQPLRILKEQGGLAWNAWRSRQHIRSIDLRRVNLSRAATGSEHAIHCCVGRRTPPGPISPG